MNEHTTWAELLWQEAPRELALLWLALGFWVLLVLIRPRSTILLRKTDSGQLAISRHALHRLLEACAEQLKGVVHARAHVSRHRGKFKTTLYLKVRPDAKLDAIQGYLTEEIRDIFSVNLGLPETAGPVAIKVVGIVPEPTAF